MDKDQYIGVFTACFGLLVIFVLVPIGVDLHEVEADTQLLVRPDFWPTIVGGIMVVVGLVYTAVSRIKYRASGSSESQASEDSASESLPFRIETRRVVAIILVILLFLISNEFTGMFIPAVAMFIVCAIGLGDGRLTYKLLGAVLVPFFLLQFFERIANIPIPLGILENFFS
jgi:putative tricarboxylic transport membrane protein